MSTNANYKKKRTDDVSFNSSEVPAMQRDQKQYLPTSKIQAPYSPFSVVPSQGKNYQTSHLINIYNENRLAAMSHIKQMNPKYRNLIIPVLPDSINKF